MDRLNFNIGGRGWDFRTRAKITSPFISPQSGFINPESGRLKYGVLFSRDRLRAAPADRSLQGDPVRRSLTAVLINPMF